MPKIPTSPEPVEGEHVEGAVPELVKTAVPELAEGELAEGHTILQEIPMVKLTVSAALARPIEILIPMRLIIYNGGSRKLLITAGMLELPEPIVFWLQQSALHHTLITRILEANAALGDSSLGMGIQ